MDGGANVISPSFFCYFPTLFLLSWCTSCLLFLLELETCGAGKLEKREGNGSVFAPLLVPFHFFFHILDSLFFFFFHFHFLN